MKKENKKRKENKKKKRKKKKIWRVSPSGSEALAKSTHSSGTKTIELAVLG